MADDGRTTLGKLARGDVFRTADGRLWWAYAPRQAPGRCWAGAVGRDEDVAEFSADTPVEPLDLPAFLSELGELRTLTHDLLLDRDAAYGREVGRGEALRVLEEEARKWTDPDAPPSHQNEYEWSLIAQTYHRAAQQIRALGPVRPLPPPKRLAARCRALEDALRGLAGAVEEVEHGHRNHGLNEIAPDWGELDGSFANLFDAAEEAREVLGENPPGG
jgi:hypothetical protein